MGIYRVYASDDGESHMEELDLAEYPALHSMLNIGEVRVQWWTEPRVMDFHPLPDRRFIIHMSGETEIMVSDGASRVFRPGDARLMEDTSGKGHSHVDRGPNSAAYLFLQDRATTSPVPSLLTRKGQGGGEKIGSKSPLPLEGEG